MPLPLDDNRWNSLMTGYKMPATDVVEWLAIVLDGVRYNTCYHLSDFPNSPSEVPMHSRLFTIVGHLALGILCVSLASAQEDQDKNVMLDKLEGTWILDSIELKGEKRQGAELPARFQGMTQTIKGDKMIFSRVDGTQFECRIVLLGEAEPYELDIIQEDREGKEKTIKCIFRIIDQTLVLAEGKDDRPTSFETSPDVSTKVSTFTLKR